VRDVEQLIASHTGRSIQLTREMIRTTPIEHLDQCAAAHARLTSDQALAFRL
jgi:hypothetical protein